MRRRLVKQGAATLMISLPSKWAQKNNLGKGDEVDIEEKQNSLVLSPESKKSKKEAKIDISSLTESSIRTILTNSYRLNYDKIKVSFHDKKALEIIHDTLKNNLIGFEVIKKTDKDCEIENLTEPSVEQFNNILSKIFLNIDELFEIAKKTFDGEKIEFEETERKIQQFDNFCRRVISKNQDENYPLIWSFHTELIHSQREIYHMLKYISKNKVNITKQTFELLQETKKIYELVKKAYNEKNISLLERTHEIEKDIIYKKGYNELKKKEDSILAHHLISASRNFYLSSSPLIGMLISKAE